jgi:membrane protease YdiL (CAAX protease family)
MSATISDVATSPWGRRLGSLGHALVVVAAAFLVAVVVVGVGIRALVGLGLLVQGSIEYRIVASVFQFVGFGLGVAAYFAVTREWDVLHLDVPSLRDVAWIAGGLVAILVAAAVIGELIARLGVTVAQNQVIEAGRQNPEFFLYMIPVSLLLVGPFEELVFRGGVQGVLRDAWGSRAAIVIAAGLFGAIHLVALTGAGSRVSYVVVAATLGLILGAVYERTRNLTVPAVVHGVYNSVLFVVQYASATGMV